MNTDQLMSYLAQNNLNDAEAQYLSEVVLDLQYDLEKALDDVSRLEVEHRLSYEEADRLFVQNMKNRYEIETLKTILHVSKTELGIQLVEKDKLKQEAITYAKEKNDASSKIASLEKDKEQKSDEIASLQSRLEKEIKQKTIEISSLQSRLEKERKQTTDQVLQISSLNLKLGLYDLKKAQEKESLQQSVNSLQEKNSDIIKRSEEKIKMVRKEQQEAQDFASKLQAEFEKSLSEQKRLLHQIQRLEMEVFDSNLEGFSNLFELECPGQNLEKIDFVPKQSLIEKCLPVHHFRAVSLHEQLVSSVMESIDKHYRNRGFGKYCRYLENNFPDTCCIL